jgi:predicted flap endonuclease-1-like 5' DNA nuclease
MQRAVDESTAKQREQEVAAEQERRAKVEAEIVERAQRERIERREREAREREEEVQAIQAAGKMLREELPGRGMVELGAVGESVGRDVEWVEELVRREGMLGVVVVDGKKVLTMMTGRGWLVKIDEDTMEDFYSRVASTAYKASDDGSRSSIGWEELGGILQKLLRSRNPSIMVDR